MPHSKILPRCALLIPHYQNIVGLAHSLASIGKNECIDVFIVDDGSRLSIDEVALKAIFSAQGSLYFIYLPYNQGIVYALNVGLAQIGQQYEYVARLDCGDLCATDRFQRQIAFLDQFPDTALVGTAVTFIDQDGSPQYTLHLPEDTVRIQKAMHVNCAFIHPTVMWRCSIAEQIGPYPMDYPMAEDFAFFWLFVRQFNTANLRDVLVWVELNPSGLSIQNRRQQLCSRLRLQWKYFNWHLYSCYGMLKTVLLMCLPYQWIAALKQRRK